MATTPALFRKALAAPAITLAIVTSTGASLVLGAGTANAAIDNSNKIVAGDGSTIEALQEDTNIQFVAPIDGNPLTREWTHDGVAAFAVDGGDSKDFTGNVTLGYQIGYPAALSGQVKFSYTTPTLGYDLLAGGPTIGNLIPTLGTDITAGFGPGIQTVQVASAPIRGAKGQIRVSGFHGTVTGVLGQLTIRPYVTVTSSHGDAVTTYGRAWTS